MAAPSLRRSTRLVPAINALPEDVLAGALAFLDAPSLVRCGGVCRGWRALLNEKPHTWEGALFELDPCAVLGPAGVAAALDAGRSCLDIAHSLGDSRCGCCRRRGALYYARAAAVRVCDAECLPSPGAAASPLINRFFFLRADEPGAIHVSTYVELLAALAACDARGVCHLNTVVMTRSITQEGDADVIFVHGLKLCGQLGLAPTLCSEHATLLAAQAVFEDLQLDVGDSTISYYADDDGHPTMELAGDVYFPAVQLVRKGHIVLRNCHTLATNGTAFMLVEAGAASLHNCTVSSVTYFGISVQPAEDEVLVGAPVTLSVRGCSFRDNSIHMKLCTELSPDDTAALLGEGNTFDAFNTQRPFNNGTFVGGTLVVGVRDGRRLLSVCVQPWRRGALPRAIRARSAAAAQAAAARAAAARAVPAAAADAGPAAKLARTAPR